MTRWTADLVDRTAFTGSSPPRADLSPFAADGTTFVAPGWRRT